MDLIMATRPAKQATRYRCLYPSPLSRCEADEVPTATRKGVKVCGYCKCQAFSQDGYYVVSVWGSTYSLEDAESAHASKARADKRADTLNSEMESAAYVVRWVNG